MIEMLLVAVFPVTVIICPVSIVTSSIDVGTQAQFHEVGEFQFPDEIELMSVKREARLAAWKTVGISSVRRLNASNATCNSADCTAEIT